MISKVKLYFFVIIIALFCYSNFHEAVNVQAADISDYDIVDSEYQYSEVFGNYEIKKYIGNNEKIIVPSSVNGHKVIGISDEAFRDNTRIKEVSISEGVNNIKSAAFLGCTSLEKVSMPSSLKIMGDNAFSMCTKLKNVSMPSDMVVLGNGVFNNCESIESITIPKGIKVIGCEFASNCYSLTKVNIPDTVNVIGSGAFCGCVNLKFIEIPESVTRLEAPFQDLKHITIIGKKGSEAEKHANALGLDFLESGTDINNKEQENSNFKYNESNSVVEITKYLGKDKNVIIPDFINNKKVTSIGFECFKDNDNIETIELPKYMEIINSKAFYNCTNLNKIILGDNIKKIKDNAFSKCVNLSNVDFPNNLQEIGQNIFDGCLKITNISIPKATRYISQGAFDNCLNLLSIDVDNENTSYSSTKGILYTSNFGGFRNLLKCPEGYNEEIVYLTDEVNYIRFNAFESTNVKKICIKGKYINVQGLKETIIAKLLQEHKIDDLSDLLSIDVSIEFLLSIANSSDKESDIEMEISFNINDTSEGKVVVIDNKNNKVNVKNIGTVINSPMDIKSVIDREISIVKNSDNGSEKNNNYNSYPSIKELSANVITKEVKESSLLVEKNNNNNNNDLSCDSEKDKAILDKSKDNKIDNSSKNNELHNSNNTLDTNKWSNTKDFLSILSFFTIVTIIGFILLSIVKYKKRCS